MGKKGRRKVFLPKKGERPDRALVDNAKALKAKIQKAHKEIQDLQDRDFKKTGVRRSRVQLLCRFRLELEPFSAMLVISQVEFNLKREIERYPKDRRLLEDLMFAQQQKSLLLESHSHLKEQAEETDCPPHCPEKDQDPKKR